MKKRKLIFIFFLLFSFCLHAQEKIFSFQNWQFRRVNDSKWYSAAIPGTIHTDLFANKLIPDPFYGLNEFQLQWIEKNDWEYKCEFDVSKEVLNKNHINIVFEGLDTYAKVFLNDSLILVTDNMFRKWETDCKKFLKEKNNQLKIIFESAVNKGIQDSIKSKYILPGGIRVYTRKAQYQYGWDWSPRYVTCGIWKPIYFKVWDDIQIQDVFYNQKVVASNKANISTVIFATSDKFQDCKILIKEKKSGKIFLDSNITFAKGLNKIPVNFSIQNPKLWWCNGLGEPFLYHLELEIYQGKEKIYSDSTELGIRTIELVQQKDSLGKTFYFKLNGVPVFMKGVNYIPPDNFLPRVSKEKYEKIIDDAISSNMNMLRVWGGGAYEDDEFYRLCDEKGILIWQDFMFACAMYPADSAFLRNVEEEAIYQVKRLHNHPCIALWCGNNEISEGWFNWEWQKQYKYSEKDSLEIWNNYTLLFDTILKSVVKKYDAEKDYYPSSPKIGWGHNESLLEGDSHYWGVWWGMEPFETYEKKVGRFMSEYGFQAYPADETMQTYLDFSQKDTSSNPNAFWHDKHPRGFQTIDEYLLRDYYNIEKTNKALKQYTYLSQLAQAYGITKAVEAHRRAMPYCMGTLYWQMNDCWPGVSWSGIDYYGRWKALQYFVKKAYSNILVSVVEENKILKTFVVSDVQKNTNAKLKLFLSDFSGKKLWQKDTTVNIKSLSSACYYSVSLSSLISDSTLKKKIFFASELYVNDSLVSRAIHYFVSPKFLKLPNSRIEREINVSGHDIKVTLSSKNLSKNVFIKTDDADDKISDNYFDLLPGERKTIVISLSSKEKDFRKRKLIIEKFKN
ncbi:MAG TPA: glycoside hydrolase family 2 protein [Bacteroidales bacterium]|nr:glycoside hydrolase family 2 protein [Bacteroidales bacterium]HPS15892.1 glycoside hydrolase family 2 protein [Bacteroidales bacterium]